MIQSFSTALNLYQDALESEVINKGMDIGGPSHGEMSSEYLDRFYDASIYRLGLDVPQV